MNQRLPILATDVATLRTLMRETAHKAAIRQIWMLVAIVLLIALLNGILVRIVAMR
ncbi:MAG TPA: hypothetical protein VFQ80_11365 [Thermomicrobiales bacterium]|nr:hypothetical protein [Thermomicrobiales bacterium]